MATRVAPASAGSGAAACHATSASHVLSDIVLAVADGIRSYKEFNARVQQGESSVEAAARAVQHVERR
ncbi:MAG: hypothetical protein AB7L90_05070 [Hyphomicrobiaceae bacterium]